MPVDIGDDLIDLALCFFNVFLMFVVALVDERPSHRRWAQSHRHIRTSGKATTVLI